VSRYVYFIQAEIGGPVKIGVAQDVSKRLAAMQIGSPFPLRVVKVIDTGSGGYYLERKLHERFAHLRERGEWFRVDPEFADFVSLPLRVPEAEDDGYRYGRVIEPPTVVDGLRPVDQAVLDVLDLERWMRCADVVPLVPGGTRALVVQILRRLGNYGFTQSRTRFTHEPYRQFLEHRRVAAPAVKMSADEAVRLAGLAT
jgi:hypothetical protein